ncbi:hypothetical protein [Mucilaginibacter gotjawali]|uniref:Uncharacterized protein n=2 Tax=Mucilaginibacter gotjawali TaxID=1550579 RepID=A0A110B2W9_9SPHI|nr:hypothetical protein [Mucilaginibacter gotjawali]MBB3055832.1 hypothetical protein [Mucilaginibacter gotjawali]BAU54653.1 hypothetical protein MgSA37_02831 [Mucilaginibacter gotjawali]
MAMLKFQLKSTGENYPADFNLQTITMENQQPTDQTINLLLNIFADICIGKNLILHLSDIYASLANLEISIKNAKINDEPTQKRESLLTELQQMEKLILDQLKEP